MIEAQDQLIIGLERLRKAGNDPDLLGLALTNLHGALEDYFRQWLASGFHIPPQQRQRVQDVQQVQWKELVDLMQQYGGLSDTETQHILKANKLRRNITHGGRFTGKRAEVESYAKYVQYRINQGFLSSPVPGSKFTNLTASTPKIDTDTKKVEVTRYRLQLLPSWILANLIGGLVGFLGAIITASLSKLLAPYNAQFIVSIPLFLSLGLAQQFVIRNLFVHQSRWWALATTAGGFLLGIIVKFLSLQFTHNQAAIQVLNNNSLAGLALILTVGLMTGLTIGGVQWLILRQQTPRAKWWIFASVIEWVLVLAGWGIIGATLRQTNAVLAAILAIIVCPSICSLITGLALIWLFPYSRDRIIN